MTIFPLHSQYRRTMRTVIRAVLQLLLGRRGQRYVHGIRLFYRLRVEAILRAGELAVLTRRTEARVWVDGSEAFPRIEKFIRAARHTIVIQMFIWKDDAAGRRMAAILLDAADRGVHVDITKEAVGDIFEFDRDFLGTQSSSDPLWRRFWSHPRVRIHYAKHSDHAKVYVIDDQILLLTGMNVADEYRYQWHDYMVELRGSAFVRQYLQREQSDAAAPVRLVMNDDETKAVRPEVVRLLKSARESIVVEHCYISDPQVLGLLAGKSREGVRVTVIIPERPDFHHHANMNAIGRLLSEAASTLRVLMYPGMIHAKILLVDRAVAFLGSANLMTSSLDRMGEVNVRIEGKHRRALQRLRDTLRRDILKSRPIVHPPHFLWLSRLLACLGL